MTTHTISFFQDSLESLTISSHQSLADVLTVQNSPVLFGCRTGICGTCLVEADGDIPPPDEEERELLEVLAPDHPKARLACQIKVTSNLAIASLHP
ncbi:MAG: 2Fe-2S iron-sulfur cluster-binding protein [Cyanobacteria bacterium P01_E01_bin.6]